MPNLQYCDKASVVSAFAADSWQRAAFADFAAVLESARIRLLRLSGSAPALPAPLTRYLPQQGSIELQRDAAGKEHAFHTHERDEVILFWRAGCDSIGRKASAFVGPETRFAYRLIRAMAPSPWKTERST